MFSGTYMLVWSNVDLDPRSPPLLRMDPEIDYFPVIEKCFGSAPFFLFWLKKTIGLTLIAVVAP